jgi:glycosyl transferase family 25
MANFVDFFDASYLINLPERVDRRKAVSAEFSRIGWRFGQSPGAVEIFPAIKPDAPGGFPSIGVRGCFLSHFECLKRAHENQCSSVLVMEDDLTLSPSISRLTPVLLSTLQTTGWDFIFLGHYFTGEIVYAESQADKINLSAAPDEVRGTHFYCVSNSVLPRLLQHLERIANGRAGDQEGGPMPIDGAFNIFRRRNPDVRAFIVTPQLGWQRFSPSDISPSQFDRIGWLRHVMRLYRSLKNTAQRRRL